LSLQRSNKKLGKKKKSAQYTPLFKVFEANAKKKEKTQRVKKGEEGENAKKRNDIQFYMYKPQ